MHVAPVSAYPAGKWKESPWGARSVVAREQQGGRTAIGLSDDPEPGFAAGVDVVGRQQPIAELQGSLVGVPSLPGPASPISRQMAVQQRLG